MKIVQYEIYNMMDSIVLSFPVDYIYKGVIELKKGILLEYDTTGKPRSLEILNASKLFNVNEHELNNIKKAEMNITITEEYINVKAVLDLQKVNKKLPIHEKIKNTKSVTTTDEHIKFTT